MTSGGATPPVRLPGGASLPAATPRIVLVVVGVLLSLSVHGVGPWLVVGAVLSLAAACAPRSLLAWLLILVLAAARLGAHPALGWRFLVLLAGLHLLHLLGMLTLQLPWRSRVSPAVFAGSLRRFVIIQAPAQAIAVVLLLTLAPGHGGHRPLTAAALSVLGALAIAGLAALLFRTQAR